MIRRVDDFDREFVGLFIGEGCIDISRQGREAHHIRPRVRIGMNERELPLLQQVQERYGGSLTYASHTRSWTWQLTGARRLRVVAEALAKSELAHAKRPEVALLLEAIELRAQPEKMLAIKNKLSALKRGE